MLSFLTRRPPRTKAPVRAFRPQLEHLEERVVLDDSSPLCYPTGQLTLLVSYGTGRLVTLYGHLTDSVNSVASQTVHFGGKVVDTTTTNTSGDYTLTELVDGLGDVTAQTDLSNKATVTLSDAAPVLLSFTSQEHTGHLWTFSGTVSYRSLQSVVINFFGAPIHVDGKTTAVQADGTFSFTVQLDGTTDDNGIVSAQAVSPYGLTSNIRDLDVWQSGT